MIARHVIRNKIIICLSTFLTLFIGCEDTKTDSGDISKVYVAFQLADKVGVFNSDNGKLIREVDVNFSPGVTDKPHFIVIDEVNNKWYVTLISSGIIAKYNLLSDEFEDSVYVGNMPALMALSPEGSYLYVSRFMPMLGGIAPQSMEIHKIDTKTMTVLGTVNMETESPHGIAMDPSGENLWVSSFSHSCLFKIDVNGFEDPNYGPERFALFTDEEQLNENAPGCGGFVDNWANAMQVAVSNDGNTVYVSLSGKSEVRAYVSSTGEHILTYDTGMMPWHIAITPDDKELYVTNRGSNSVSVLDLSRGTYSVTTIDDPSFDMLHGVGISGDGSRVFVSSSGENSALHILDSKNGDVIKTITLRDDIMATGVAVMQSTCNQCD